MPTATYREQADQALQENLAHYAANPLQANHLFAFNSKNQRFLNSAQPYKQVVFGKYLVAFLIGLALAVFAAYWVRTTADFDTLLAKDGITTQATVVDKYTQDSRKDSGSRSTKRTYFLTIEFTYQDTSGQSRVVHHSESVSSTFYNKQREGGTIPVVYAPADPTQLRIPGDSGDTDSALAALLAVPVGLILAVVNGFFLARQLGTRRTLKQGQVLIGTVTRVEKKENRAGNPVAVTVEYTFATPDRQSLSGQVVFPAKNFKGRWHLVEPGKPLAVLYRNERNYAVL